MTTEWKNQIYLSSDEFSSALSTLRAQCPNRQSMFCGDQSEAFSELLWSENCSLTGRMLWRLKRSSAISSLRWLVATSASRARCSNCALVRDWYRFATKDMDSRAMWLEAKNPAHATASMLYVSKPACVVRWRVFMSLLPVAPLFGNHEPSKFVDPSFVDLCFLAYAALCWWNE